jgi:hypothetical protein
MVTLGAMPDGTQHEDVGAVGDGHAVAALIPLVYEELRAQAAARLARESAGHTLDSAALVHEAFVRLGGDRSFGSKSGFLRAAAVAMRRVNRLKGAWPSPRRVYFLTGTFHN